MRPLRTTLLRAVALALLLSCVTAGAASADDGTLDAGSAGAAVGAETFEPAIEPNVLPEDPGLEMDLLPEDPGLE
jgi:hypothetical protein